MRGINNLLFLERVFMQIFGWIVWSLGCGWAVVVLVSFLVDVFRPNPNVQPMDTELFPYALDGYLSTNEKRMISSLYFIGISASLIMTLVSDISKLHLLWFLPLFHCFGTQWSVRLSRYFQKKRKNKTIVCENNDEDMQR